MKFYKEMENLAEKLREAGHEVKVPLLRIEVEEAGKKRNMSITTFIEERGGIDLFGVDHPVWEEKSSAIDAHFEKIEWGDAVLAANYDKRGVAGYVGGNTLMEMGLAKYLQKKIYLLLPVSSEVSYKEEILGMKPIILNNDLTLVK